MDYSISKGRHYNYKTKRFHTVKLTAPSKFVNNKTNSLLHATDKEPRELENRQVMTLTSKRPTLRPEFVHLPFSTVYWYITVLQCLVKVHDCVDFDSKNFHHGTSETQATRLDVSSYTLGFTFTRCTRAIFSFTNVHKHEGARLGLLLQSILISPITLRLKTL